LLFPPLELLELEEEELELLDEDDPELEEDELLVSAFSTAMPVWRMLLAQVLAPTKCNRLSAVKKTPETGKSLRTRSARTNPLSILPSVFSRVIPPFTSLRNPPAAKIRPSSGSASARVEASKDPPAYPEPGLNGESGAPEGFNRVT
jgi:hypothetical protein